MRLQFSSNQTHQTEAIGYTVAVFDGISRQAIDRAAFMGAHNVVSNFPEGKDLDLEQLLSNLQGTQSTLVSEGKEMGISHELQIDYGNLLEKRNPHYRGSYIATSEGQVLEGVNNDVHHYPHFAIEMETGTGKTYVYLRSIYELNVKYGFTKFVIVVPSVAIRIGVVKSFEAMREHFHSLYGNTRAVLFEYDSDKMGQLRTFATSQDIQIMVMTLQAFNKAGNNLFKSTEKLQGEWLPYEYIQAVRPILIIDEPQKMTSDKSAEALRTLKPLFALRYSATFPDKNKETFVYRLTPIEAFQQGLVKKIQVVGVEEEDDLKQSPIVLEGCKKSGKKFEATVLVYAMKEGRKIRRQVVLTQGDNLYEKTQNKAFLGYVVHNISAAQEDMYVEFSNGLTFRRNEEQQAAGREQIFRYQIAATIEEHFERQARLRKQGIKVLSLFFIDKVKNYVGEGEETGVIRKIFDEEFNRLKRHDPNFKQLAAAEVQASYFACTKDKKFVDTEGATEQERSLEQEQFKLIMERKEQLLSFDEKTCFIFAHSALREGWDNPNIFQICTLNNTVSIIRKRQEIGRGLRICVNQAGERVFGNDVNILTIIANESYESFAAGLQEEYQEDGGTPPPDPSNKKGRKTQAQRRDELFGSVHFRAFWAKLLQKAQYKIQIDSKALIAKCQKAFKDYGSQLFEQPKVLITEGKFELTSIKFVLERAEEEKAWMKIYVGDTARKDTMQFGKFYEVEVDVKTDLEKWFEAKGKEGKEMKYFFRGFKVSDIEHTGTVKKVNFKNGQSVSDFEDLIYPVSHIKTDFSKAVGDKNTDDFGALSFNIVKRAADATGLTVATIGKIFREMDSKHKLFLFKNPDVFTNSFVTLIRNVMAEHIAERIEFSISPCEGDMEKTLEAYFPATKEYIQVETINSNEKGLYDLVQKDSEVERIFVEERLHKDGDLVLYFKFPASFKINFPKIIHDYTPDWGILREVSDANGKRFIVELVRETKGTTDKAKLRFLGEQRKIDAAIRFFRAIGIDYKVISHETIDVDWQRMEQFPIHTQTNNMERKTAHYLKSVVIRNYQGIKNIDLQGFMPDNKWIFITGENSFGKTNFLQAIAIGLRGGEHLPKQKTPTEIAVALSDGGLSLRTHTQESDAMANVVGYGSSRLMPASSESVDKELKSPTASLFEVVALRNIEFQLSRWYFKKNIKEFREKYEGVEAAFKTLLPNLHEIRVDERTDEVSYVERDAEGNVYPPVPLSKMASGYKSLIVMFGDMMLRLFEANNEEKRKLTTGEDKLEEITNPAELEGIVLIDEIDVHLHPKLQRELPELLSRVFPKVQFIVSTHSPIPLLGAAENSVFIKITRTAEEGTKAERLVGIEAEAKNLPPQLLLSSPVFGLTDIYPKTHKEGERIRTEETYAEKLASDEREDKLTAYLKDEKAKERLKNLFKKEE